MRMVGVAQWGDRRLIPTAAMVDSFFGIPESRKF
jgi:hypothetical protein